MADMATVPKLTRQAERQAVLKSTGKSLNDCKARIFWAEHIHQMLQESADLRRWKVQPKRYRRGYCATTFEDQKAAEHERERLERITGFEWTITVIPE